MDVSGRRVTTLVPLQSNQQSRSVNVFAAFADSVRRQMKERKDFQEGVKQLSATGEELAGSDLVKGAKAAAEATGGAVRTVVDGVEKVVNSEAVQKTVEVTSKVVGAVAKPVVDNPITRTAASGAQALHQAVADPDSTATNRYMPYKSREIRDAEREAREKKLQQEIAANPFLKSPDRPVEANTEASGVQLHESSRWAAGWEKFKETNPVMQKMFAVRSAMEESDNPLVERFRDVYETLGRAFGENENAQTVRRFKMVDPRFRTDKFVKDAHEWIIPDLMESYLRSDVDALKDWCGESVSYLSSSELLGLFTDPVSSDVLGSLGRNRRAKGARPDLGLQAS
jgi:import inner membrane translocase subunit TIM44